MPRCCCGRRRRWGFSHIAALLACFLIYGFWQPFREEISVARASPDTMVQQAAAGMTEQQHSQGRPVREKNHVVQQTAAEHGFESRSRHEKSHDVTGSPFAAWADGKTIITEELQKAIDSAADLGGEVVLPPGVFLTGSLFLRSNLVLRLSAGTRLQAVAPPEMWGKCKKDASGNFANTKTCNPARFDTWHHFPKVYVPDLQWDIGGFQHAALLNGGRCRRVMRDAGAYGDRCSEWNKLRNVSIIGAGDSSVIDGAGERWWKYCPKMWAAPGRYTGPCPDDCNRDTQRPKLIHMMFVDGLSLHNFTAQNSAFWTIVPQYSKHVQVHRLRIRAPPHSHNTDGVDPQSCINVSIQDLDISTGDDCIAIYSGSNLQGRTLGYPTRNVTVKRVTCRKGHGMTVGSRTAAGIFGVLFQNITCIGTDVCVRLKTCRGRGGVVENVVYDGVSLTRVGEAIRVDMQYEYRVRTNASATPHIRNLLIRNVRGTAKMPGLIRGLMEAPAEVHLESIDIGQKRVLQCTEAKLATRDVSVDVDVMKRCAHSDLHSS